MACKADREERPATVQTGVWVDEHNWLHRVYKSAGNTSPRFRFPDLLSACVSLTLSSEEGVERLVCFLSTELTQRTPRAARRSCDIWPAQFEQLLVAHRAAWNRFPNPMFELDQLTTGCVALTMALPDGQQQVLAQARENLQQRASSRHTGARGPQ